MYYFLSSCENCISSAEQGGVSSVESFADIPVSVLLRLNLTAEKSCCKDSEMESCHGSQSGMTCEHSTASLGADSLIACVEDSHAKILAQPEVQTEKDWKVQEVDSGLKWREWFVKFDHDTSSWKIPQLSFFEGLEESLGIWIRWGMMRHGECFRLAMLEHDMSVRGCGLLPMIGTPLKTQRSRSEDFMSRARNPFELCPKGYLPSPKWVERLMGWPDGWTDLQPLGMDKFQVWLDSHGKH